MQFPKSLLLLIVTAGLLDGVVAQQRQGQGQGQRGQGKGQGQGQGGQGQAAAASAAAASAAAASAAAASAAAASAAAATAAAAKGGQGKGQGGQGQAAAASAAAASAAAAQATAAAAKGGQGGGNNGGNGGNGGNADNSLTLSQDVINTASQSVGNVNATAGEAESITSNNNFINFCEGKTITNGKQIQGGSCNPIPMGDIPSTDNMVSTFITSPQTGETLPANTDFTFQAQTANLQAGTFTNAASTYYSAVQQLVGGQIQGHMHFSAQKIDGLNPTTPPDASTFAFFKGVDDAGNGNGLLSATVAGGLPAGTYRVCTLSSAANHQPVIMPVAQRGPQDDCTKFTVANGGGGGNAGNNAQQGQQAAQGQKGQGQGGNGQAAAAAAAQQQAANGKQGGGQRGRQRGRFARRQFIA